MRKPSAILLFSKPPRITRSNQDEPYAALPWEDLDALFTALLGDVLEHACRLSDADILLYRHQADLSDDFLHPFGDRIKCSTLLNGSLTENVHHAVEAAFAGLYQRVVVLLENHPVLDTAFLAKIVQQLSYEDDCLVVGPALEGGCFLIGMKSNHSELFEKTDQDPLVKPNVLMKRLCGTDSILFLTQPTYLLDSGFSLARLKGDLDKTDGLSPGFPKRTYEMFKLIDKKYRLKKPAR
ncbi:MAG TPA: DUF2064 domain-containing protein [Bacteroidota bacterium]|nr:DUF2064 domain-containing protein [Bacteroidota bacterium]